MREVPYAMKTGWIEDSRSGCRGRSSYIELEASSNECGLMSLREGMSPRYCAEACYSFWLRKSRYRNVSREVSAAAMYVQAAAVSTRFVPPASECERTP